MSKSFLSLDDCIEINEKRDAEMRAEYDKTLGRLSNILIIYSGVSVFLVSVCQDLFNQPINYWYLIFLIAFGVLFIISFYYSIRFLYPNLTPYLATPKKYYYDLRSQMETALMNGAGAITQEDRDEIDSQLKTAYLYELEDIINKNVLLIDCKQAFYLHAIKYAIYCIFPFFACIIFHILRPEVPLAVEIVDTENSRKLVPDTINVLNIH